MDKRPPAPPEQKLNAMQDALTKAGHKSSQDKERERKSDLVHEVKHLFEQVLKDNFSEIPPGVNFPVKTNGFDQITVVTAGADPKKAKSAFVYAWYKKGNQDRKIEFTIGPNGDFMGVLPPAFGDDEQKILLYKTVLEKLKELDVGYYRKVSGKTFPQGEGSPKEERGGTGPTLTPDNLKRLTFIRSLTKESVGFVGEDGFNGYRGFVMPELQWAVLEHPVQDKGALFIIKDIPEIPGFMEASKDEQTKMIEAQPWFPIVQLPRPQAKKMPNVERIEHKVKQGKEFDEQIVERFDLRRKEIAQINKKAETLHTR